MGNSCCCSTSCKDNELCDYTLSHKDPNLFDRSQVGYRYAIKNNTFYNIVQLFEIIYDEINFLFSGAQKDELAYGT